jgi:nitrite reductase/ring-hydroxylating ferredoxin subunit
MSFFSRILGRCTTKPPSRADSWSFTSGRLELDLDRTPELSQPGGALRLEGSGLPARVLVVRGLDGGFHAFHNKCPHGGRRIDPLADRPVVECCSVGRSTFDYQGGLISGSAKKDLKAFQVEQVDNKLRVILE